MGVELQSNGSRMGVKWELNESQMGVEWVWYGILGSNVPLDTI